MDGNPVREMSSDDAGKGGIGFLLLAVLFIGSSPGCTPSSEPEGITGRDLSDRTYQQAVNALVQFRFNEELVTIEDTDQIENEDELKRVVTTSCVPALSMMVGAFTGFRFPRSNRCLPLRAVRTY